MSFNSTKFGKQLNYNVLESGEWKHDVVGMMVVRLDHLQHRKIVGQFEIYQ